MAITVNYMMYSLRNWIRRWGSFKKNIMNKLVVTILLGFFILSCKTEIKNGNPKIEIEKGTEVQEDLIKETQGVEEEIIPVKKKVEVTDSRLGFWVGYFEKDIKYGYKKNIYADEGFDWNRENKINISIDSIKDTIVVGHSVVAGNNRPFKGKVSVKDGVSFFKVQEPGDHKYDGEFTFTIEDFTLNGTWEAFNNIDINKRKYNLSPKTFEYNPDVSLERAQAYVEWSNYKEQKSISEYEEGVFEEWISKEFATASGECFVINASNTLLVKSQVENLKKGDLKIIRNTIYARHGYSFKNRHLRVFFDAQSWYIPVFTNIKEELTEIEKQNIKLLLLYEKNAEEYYDYFGRG